MIKQIWRILTQLLRDKNNLGDVVKPFFHNLKNENINHRKYIPLLKTFSKFQLEVLFKNQIITKENFYSLNPNQKPLDDNKSEHSMIEKIILSDKVDELRKFIQEKDINTFNTITTSFREVDQMKIPLIQYCIIQKAIECFKYLLVNGYNDPNETMEELNSETFLVQNNPFQKKKIKRYQWDCMATAIYMGNSEIIKILESKGIIKGSSYIHHEAAILSHRNSIAKELIEATNSQMILNFCLRISSKSNNITITKLLIEKEADVDDQNLNPQNI